MTGDDEESVETDDVETLEEGDNEASDLVETDATEILPFSVSRDGLDHLDLSEDHDD